jgi:hypothetical protein
MLRWHVLTWRLEGHLYDRVEVCVVEESREEDGVSGPWTKAGVWLCTWPRA